MLDQDGTICFASELMETLGAFMSDYETVKGPLPGDLERCLAVCYALGVMQHNLDTIWECLGREPAFGHVDPHRVFEECVGQCDEEAAKLRACVGDELHRRGWLAPAESG